MLLLGNVGGKQEIRNTQRRRLTGTHAPFYEEGMAEGTRIILPENQRWGWVENTGCSEIKRLNMALLVALWVKLMAGGRSKMEGHQVLALVM